MFTDLEFEGFQSARDQLWQSLRAFAQGPLILVRIRDDWNDDEAETNKDETWASWLARAGRRDWVASLVRSIYTIRDNDLPDVLRHGEWVDMAARGWQAGFEACRAAAGYPAVEGRTGPRLAADELAVFANDRDALRSAVGALGLEPLDVDGIGATWHEVAKRLPDKELVATIESDAATLLHLYEQVSANAERVEAALKGETLH